MTAPAVLGLVVYDSQVVRMSRAMVVPKRDTFCFVAIKPFIPRLKHYGEPPPSMRLGWGIYWRQDAVGHLTFCMISDESL